MKSKFLKLVGISLMAFAAAASLSPSVLKAAMKSRRAASQCSHDAISQSRTPDPGKAARSRVSPPAIFHENRGGATKQLRFISSWPGHRLSLTSSAMVLELRKTTLGEASALPENGRRRFVGEKLKVGVKLVGSNATANLSGREPATPSAKSGAEVDQRMSGYAKVHVAEAYPGIDVIYQGDDHQLGYDFVVAPHGDPRRIRIAFEGIDSMELSADGNLRLRSEGHAILQHKPTVYQEIGGVRREIGSGYVLLSKSEVGFELAPYDKNHPLVIDPVLAYSAYDETTSEETASEITAVKPQGNCTTSRSATTQ